MIDGYVLAGGASSRMGTPKRDLIIGSKTMLERAVAVLSAIAGDNVYVAAEREYRPTKITEFKYVEDVAQPNSNNCPLKAAIVGLHSALAHSRSSHVFVLACDMPFVSDAVVRTMYSYVDRIEDGSSDVIVPLDADGRIQPLCAIYARTRCLRIVEKAIANGGFTLRDLLMQMQKIELTFQLFEDLPGSKHFFFNVNTPTDLSAAQKLAAVTPEGR